MRWFCAAVKNEGRFNPHRHRFSYVPSGEFSIDNTLVPMFSLRAKSTFKGITNRGTILPVHMSVSAFNNATPTNEERVVIEVYNNPTLTSPTWTEDPSTDSMVELDIGASGFTGGTLVGSLVVSGAMELSLAEFFKYTGNNIKNRNKLMIFMVIPVGRTRF
jgi:hypothetical protein